MPLFCPITRKLEGEWPLLECWRTRRDLNPCYRPWESVSLGGGCYNSGYVRG